MAKEHFVELLNNIEKVEDLQTTLVYSIAGKIAQDRDIIERALYLTSVSCVSRPDEVALIVDAFLAHLRELTVPEQGQEQEESPFIGRDE
jgi:hypothetical protein